MNSISPRRSLLLSRLLLAAMTLFFVGLAVKHRWYNDDAFITFRYSNHLANGLGIVWNPGEAPLEGSTSLAWTVLNAAAIAVKQNPVPVSHAVGIVCGAIGLWLVWRAARHRLQFSAWIALIGPAALFASRQYVVHSVSALETMAAATVTLAATLRLSKEAGAAEQTRPWSGALFFLGTMLRPETPLLHLAAGAGWAAIDRRRASIAAIVRSGLLHAGLLGLLTAFRLWYFGQLLPNTFYIKVGGLQLGHGLRYWWEFLLQGQAWVALVALAVYLVRERGRYSPLLVSMLAQVLALGLWILVQGGDAWEFRFFVVLLPALALFVVAGVESLRRAPKLRPLAPLLAAAAIALPVVPLFRGFHDFFPVVSAEHLRATCADRLRDGAVLSKVLGPSDRIAFGWAGALPYVTNAWTFDVWGLNDRDGARWPFDKSGVLYHQRHAGWNEIAARGVMFADVFNNFLFDAPYPPAQIPADLMPWAEPGAALYCVELPSHWKYRFWIFASPKPQSEVMAWLKAKGLAAKYVAQVPARVNVERRTGN